MLGVQALPLPLSLPPTPTPTPWRAGRALPVDVILHPHGRPVRHGGPDDDLTLTLTPTLTLSPSPNPHQVGPMTTASAAQHVGAQVR